ncbi:MAG TPA: hypothetical protein ENN18_01655 [Proteobacteria bacterium]|mgnify:CR=1 FL=1|nr:hypothetical protein [Pseudomonadota bacterium]
MLQDVTILYEVTRSQYMDAEELSKLKLHPCFEYLEKKSRDGFPPIPGLRERIKPGPCPVTVATDNVVVAGVGLFNLTRRRNQKRVPVRRVSFSSEAPDALIVCLREIAANAPLLVKEAERIIHNYKKIGAETREAPEPLTVQGLVDELFELYRTGNPNGKIPHFQALELSRNIPYEIQERIIEDARATPLKALDYARLVKKKEQQSEKDMDRNILVENVLKDPATRKLLFDKLASITSDPLESLELRELLSNVWNHHTEREKGEIDSEKAGEPSIRSRTHHPDPEPGKQIPARHSRRNQTAPQRPR